MRRLAPLCLLALSLSATALEGAPAPERAAAQAQALESRLARLRQGACGSPGHVFALRQGGLIEALSARARAIGSPQSGSAETLSQLNALAEEMSRACQSGEREMARRAAAR